MDNNQNQQDLRNSQPESERVGKNKKRRKLLNEKREVKRPDPIRPSIEKSINDVLKLVLPNDEPVPTTIRFAEVRVTILPDFVNGMWDVYTQTVDPFNEGKSPLLISKEDWLKYVECLVALRVALNDVSIKRLGNNLKSLYAPSLLNYILVSIGVVDDADTSITLSPTCDYEVQQAAWMQSISLKIMSATQLGYQADLAPGTPGKGNAKAMLCRLQADRIVADRRDYPREDILLFYLLQYYILSESLQPVGVFTYGTVAQLKIAVDAWVNSTRGGVW